MIIYAQILFCMPGRLRFRGADLGVLCAALSSPLRPNQNARHLQTVNWDQTGADRLFFFFFFPLEESPQ